MVSGFPEPYFSGKETTYRRWSNTYSRQLIREDIRDLNGVKAITEIETLFMLLPFKVGSPLSVTSLAEDLNDMGYGNFSLHFIRNKEHQEVDFLVSNDNKPILMIEAKISEKNPSKALVKFQNDLCIPAVQLHQYGDRFKIIQNGGQKILVAPAFLWLPMLAGA